MMWMQKIIDNLLNRLLEPFFLSISDSYDSLHFCQGILKRLPMMSRWMQHVSSSGH